MNQMSMEMNQNKKQEWRRSKVRELLVKGYNHYEIATTLQIPRPTITKDIQYLKQLDQVNLQTHIQERIPHVYENCIIGADKVIRLTSEIVEKPTDYKTKLDALALLNDCYKLKIDMITGGVYVTNAFNSVQSRFEAAK